MTAVAAANTTELVRFLLSRVDDDDEHLRRQRRHHTRGTAAVDTRELLSIDRLRAEIEAKRTVIAHAQQLLVLRDQPAEKPVRDAAVQILRALAATYREHSAYRTEWDGRRGK